MKELSIEEKARRYDKAFRIAQELYDNPNSSNIGKGYVCTVFPELKDSDDERIRKALLNEFIHLQSTGYKFAGLEGEELIAWLEKQGKQKQTVIIPRFRVEDVITSTKNSALKYKIKAVGVLNELGEYDYVVEDVTDNPDYKGRIRNMSISKVDEWGVVIEQKPNTDFSDLRTWKYIVDAVLTEKEGIGQYLDSPVTEEVAKKLQKRFGNIQQKTAWSEEDESMLFNVIWHLRDSVNKGDQSSPAGKLEPWIRTLKDRVLPQPKQEWSEEDKEMIEALNTYVKQLDVMFSEIKIGDKDILAKDFRENVQNWLKSLKHRYTWKPSEEQMDALSKAIAFVFDSNSDVKHSLESLYNELKKL